MQPYRNTDTTEPPVPIVLDGRMGEGGGQVLRTALALSVVTGRPLHLEHIRGGRRKAGLRRQHLACVRAATAVSGATVVGAELNSGSLRFHPGHLRPGTFELSVGSAGSAALVLQTVLAPLLLADGPSEVVVRGGTHNAWAPPADFLELSFVPQLRAMGLEVEVECESVGFFPAGGGVLRARIPPAGDGVRPLELLERGDEGRHYALIRRAHLEADIADREWHALQRVLYWRAAQRRDLDHPESRGPGNCVHAVLQFDAVTEVVTSFGSKGRGARHVAEEAAKAARRYLATGAPVGRHLCDQLMLPLALFAGGRFRTLGPTRHATTNAEVIAAFLGDVVTIEEAGSDEALVTVTGRPD